MSVLRARTVWVISGIICVLFLLPAGRGCIAAASQRSNPQAMDLPSQNVYNQALHWITEGHAEKAVEELTPAIAANPSNATLFNLLGLAYSNLGELAQAEADFKAAIRLSPESPVGYNNLAVSLAHRGQVEGAIQFFEKSLRVAPGNFTALSGLGTLLLNHGNLDQAQPLLRHAWAERPEDFPTGYELALCLRELRDPESAERIILLIAIPHHSSQAAKYHALRAAIADDLGESGKAFKEYRHAYQFAPRDANLYLALVRSCLVLPNCKPDCLTVRVPASLSAEQHFALGLLFASHRFYAMAIPHFKDTLEAAPDSYSAAYDLAISEEESGNARAAIKTLRNLIQLRPEAELYDLVASDEEREGFYLEAVRDYQKAVEKDPTREEYYFDLGSDFLDHFAFDPARQIFQAASRKYPGVAREFTGLGFALYAERDYLGAAKAFLRALQINPESREPFTAYNSLIGSVVPADWKVILPQLKSLAGTHPQNARAIYCYGVSLFQHDLARNDLGFREAQAVLERAIHLEPNFSEAYLALGRLYAARKEDASALSAFLEAVRLNPHSATAHYQLAQTYRKLNRIDFAEKELGLYTQMNTAKEQQMDQIRAHIKQFILKEEPLGRTLKQEGSTAKANH